MLSKIILCSVGLVVIVITGIGTSQLGKPYNPAVFGLHKIVAVGTLILLVVIIRRLTGTGEHSKVAPIVFTIAGLLFLTLIVSGSLLALSIGPELVLRVHQVIPLLAIGFSVLSVYLLVGSDILNRIGAGR